MSWVAIDEQMSAYRERLRDQLKIGDSQAGRLATEIAAEVRFLPRETKDELRHTTSIDLQDRLEELAAFQAFMDITRTAKLDSRPEVVRAKVIVQNYVCFVYLSESCFLILRKNMPSGSATRKCAKFLTDNPVRSFRNAIAHSNWGYTRNYTGLRYWSRKGAEPNEPLVEHLVSQTDLSFWQALCRCVAYAAFSDL